MNSDQSSQKEAKREASIFGLYSKYSEERENKGLYSFQTEWMSA